LAITYCERAACHSCPGAVLWRGLEERQTLYINRTYVTLLEGLLNLCRSLHHASPGLEPCHNQIRHRTFRKAILECAWSDSILKAVVSLISEIEFPLASRKPDGQSRTGRVTKHGEASRCNSAIRDKLSRQLHVIRARDSPTTTDPSAIVAECSQSYFEDSTVCDRSRAHPSSWNSQGARRAPFSTGKRVDCLYWV